MKIANYHTHTHLCNHAEGKPLDYVKQALLEGCTELGFSDHCPYPEEFDDTWSDVRMNVGEVPLYISEVEEARALAQQPGNNSFPVYLGFECEYDKRYESWYRDDLKGRFGAQYLVLGSHWVTMGSEHIYCPELDNSKDLNKYIDQTIEGMRSGLFSFLAHPDLFMKGYKEWDEQSRSCLQAILDAAEDLNLPIEVNGLGMSRTPNETSHGMRYQYPYVEFWEMVSTTKAPVICNADAHDPHDVIFNAQKARDFAGRFGIIPISTLNLQNK